MPVPRKIKCTVQKLIDHGEHVYTVDLAPEERVPQFRPGQFLHLALDMYDPSGFWPDSRVFSIASPPSQRDHLRISYSVQGRFTARMERELTVDAVVWAKLPYGDFVIDDTRDVALFAGGTGITAFCGFLEEMPKEFRHEVYLAYGARNRNLLIYRDMIDEWARTKPRLHVFYFVECDPNAASFKETIGRLSVDAIKDKVPLRDGALCYLSGPPGMQKALSQDLTAFGVTPNSIRTDAWE